MRITSLADYQKTYELSVREPEKFWAGIANQFDWIKPFTKVLDWNFDDYSVKWFEDGQMNITANALDRHLKTIPDQAAIIYEPNEPGDEAITLTYRELHARVCKFSNVLKNQGVVKGDRVCIYMPMIPELAIAVLACARIGAIHSVVFGGFSAQSIADRINDSECKVVVTTDGAVRGNKSIPMKETVDDALVTCPSVEKVIVKTRTKTPVSMIGGRDLWWEQEENEASADCPAEAMNAEDPLFILYTSGSTGKPKGVVHTCGGYMVYTAYTFANVFQYKPGEVFFCTADIGWITGHSYLVYGPLLNGAKSVLFEGIPTYPDAGRFWDIIKRHSVNIFYTAPTAIRSLMGFGDEHIEGKDLSSLRVLGSVGEPLNEEAWHWYNDKVGHGNCPIVDTWWQTETGGLMISPIAGITPLKPAFATLPLPGVQPILVDENGKEITGNGVNGNLCIKYPWPSIIRTTYGDHERCKSTYFSTYPGLYFTGDGCMRDEDGYYRITGRVDDVMNISGHRIGTAEVENAINMHTGVIESAVVGYPHDIKGQGIYAYVICEHPTINDDLTRKDILATVTRVIGPIAKPDKIQFVTGLPKTRSGKIMRRILRKVAEGDTSNLGDTSTLLDPGVVDSIISGAL
ncbi:acetate--CoA ligase [Aquirufa antheringensis]|uniref:acetate--CoA ligase n=1 Tax=Aquirufa antheringensis TaxID=2516559 RepID=UPI00208F5000|nr:acetate--CoA ligase [Aquirufa antheringensis]USQ04701.1 acetate--CoA ligase [Aquirufa antheringensis]